MSWCLVAIFTVAIGLPVAGFALTATRVLRANRRFLAAARRAELSPVGRARLELVPATSTLHAVWLDLDVRGADPAFTLDLEVASPSTCLLVARGECRYEGEGDFRGPAPEGPGSPFAISLHNTKLGGPDALTVQSIQRVALFTPTTGEALTISIGVTPHPGTTLARCAMLVTDTPEP